MKRFLKRISLALMATVICAPAMAQPDTASATTQVAAMPSAPITIGSIYWGTGFFVDRNGHVLTANHLVTDCTSLDIVGNGRREEATVLASNADADLSILRVSETFGEPVAFDSGETLSGGAMVTILGYAPLGEALRSQGAMQPALSNSMVLDEQSPKPEDIALVSDANPGASGSPVITRDGLVVGVLRAKIIREGMTIPGQPREIRLAASGSAAKNFLRLNGVTPIEGSGAQHTRLALIGDLSAAEVKIECHR